MQKRLKNKLYVMKKTTKYDVEYPVTPLVSEPMGAYGIRNEVSDRLKYTLRNDIKSVIEGEELLNRLRPRIKSLFK